MVSGQFQLIPALVAVLVFLGESRATSVYTMSMEEVEDGSLNKQASADGRLNKQALADGRLNKQALADGSLNKQALAADQTFAFAKHLQNNMVLQKTPARANIYGFSSEIGQKVICQMVTHTQQYYYYSTTVQQGQAAGIGVWSFTLDPIDANITVSITVNSELGSLSLSNVIFGDVWLCSGQSNMQFTVIQMLRAEQELEDAQNYPNIRIMTVAQETSDTPLYDLIAIQQAWTSPSRASIGGPAWSYFSAVCWLYGKAIHKALGVPIGLVATDWGGTPIEAWSSAEALAKCYVTANTPKKQQSGSFSRYTDKLPPSVESKVKGPQNNSVLWNAMVNPLLSMTIYGAIWYQGEDDASGVKMNHYNCTFPAMIKDWRQNFNKFSHGQTNASFPFGFVQLAPNTADPTISVGFPDIRFHQTADWGYTPNPNMLNVFMAVTMDLPDFNSPYDPIHPRDKTDVGIRLSLAGLAVAYGWQEMFQGPFPVNGELTSEGFVLDYGDNWNLEIRDTEGFELLCGGNKPLRKWVPTSIIASNQTSVTLFSSVCGLDQQVKGLRYAWRESPCEFKKCAVYEIVNGLPAAPFIVLDLNSSNEKPHFKFDGKKYY